MFQFFSRNEVLPLVHQTWQPLKLLFTSNNLFVVEKAFGVLKILANCAKDFIRKRTIEDVFPALANYLRKLQVCMNVLRSHSSEIRGLCLMKCPCERLKYGKF